MSAIAWKAAVSGAWGDPNNWDLGRVPGSGDDVTIAFPSITVTSSEGGNTAHSLNSQAGLAITAGSLAIATGPVVSGPITLSGGVLQTAGTWNASALTWTGGALTGQPTITVPKADTLTISGAAGKSLAGPTLVNDGVILWSGSGGIALSNGSLLDNAAGGAFEVLSDAALNASGSPTPALHNEGLLIKQNSTGNSTFIVAVTNSGTLNVASGTLAISGTGGSLTNLVGTTLTGGTYVVSGTLQIQNASISTNAATIALDGPGSRIIDQSNTNALVGLVNNAAGANLILRNRSSLLVPSGFTNAGTVFLGPADTLQVPGTYHETATGVSDLQVGGSPVSGLFGQLAATGAATLGGVLNISLANGFVPATGDSYQILTYASATGKFAAITGLVLPGRGKFTAIPAPTFLGLITEVNTVIGDYDGDGKTDLAVFRPPDSTWFIKGSTNGGVTTQFGAPGDIPVPADYDGDGKTDLAVFRPSTDQWFIRGSSAGPRQVTFGGPGDIPVPADYDGDGKTDIAVFRPSTGTWYIQGSTAGPEAIQFGAPGDIPVAADYDGDGKADLAVYRPSNATWYILQSTLGPRVQPFGIPGGSLPVPADYDGDGKADLAVVAPATSTWYIQQSTAGARTQQFGGLGDVPVPGDYDGDGKTDLAVYRPSNATWYILQSTAGGLVQPFGAPAVDVPLPTPLVYRFNGNTGTSAASRGSASDTTLANNGSSTLTDRSMILTSASNDPLVVVNSQADSTTALSTGNTLATPPAQRRRDLSLHDTVLDSLAIQ
ncbi:MAG TPA: FG-GAP-like repeat-containing protein [Isosphaeraceae bacterium]|nr:FG-GAP-like repeat-containing protein [Isosphaeraceae bacterium]